MPSYLIAAYAIFVAVPLLLALSLYLRHRQVERAVRDLRQAEREGRG